MVRLADIRTALDRNQIERIEDAFGVLAAYPHGGGIEGATSVDDVMDILDRVVERLADDHRTMPARTSAAILRVKPDKMTEGASYAEGARVVAAHRKHWHAVFLIHVRSAPGDGRRAEDGRDAHGPTWVSFELSGSLAKGLDAFILARPEAKLSRPEAARVILRHALAGLGYLGEPEVANRDGPGAPI